MAKTWQGGGDNWNTPGDWSPPGDPVAGDDVTIQGGTPVVNTNVGTVASVTTSSGLDVEGGGTLATTGNFTATGAIILDELSKGNATLTVGGTFSNDFSLQVGTGFQTGPDVVTVGSLVQPDTPGDIAGMTLFSATLIDNATAGFGTQGLLTGSVMLSGPSLLQFANGQITTIDTNSGLRLDGANAFVADAGMTGSNSALQYLATNNGGTLTPNGAETGGLNLNDGAALTTLVAFTNNGLLDVGLDGFGGRVPGGGSFTVGGSLTNSSNAVLNIDANSGAAQESSYTGTVTASSLANSGAINLKGGFDYTSTTPQLASLVLTSGNAGFGTDGMLSGKVSLTGDSLIQFATGQITTIAAGSQLLMTADATGNAYVADANAPGSNSALAGLATNDGTLALTGETVTTTGTINNASGTIGVGGEFNLSAALVQRGALDSQSLAGFGALGVQTGIVTIGNGGSIQFADGQINTIDGALTINGPLAYLADAGTPTSNSALMGLTTVNGGLSLLNGTTVMTTGPLTNNGALGVGSLTGSSVGATLNVGGVLTNDNALGVIGGFDQDSTLTALGLVNMPTPNAAGTGAINISMADVTITGAATNTGTITDAQSTVDITGATTGGGSFTLDGYGSLGFGGASDNTIAFMRSNNFDANTLILDTPGAFTGSITGFSAGINGPADTSHPGDTLDLAHEIVTIQSYDGTTLVVKTAGGATQSFALSGPAAGSLTATSDNNGGTDITVGAVCFVTGSRILTTRGEVPVENLVVGDVAVTASGACRQITWIGHRDIACKESPDVMPVRIAAHAFATGVPARDLFLSPGHPVLVGADADVVGGHLVPIMCLINGTTVRRMPAEAVTYWHVELDSHDILLAEGLAAESYLDWGDRAFFSEGADHRLANPDFVVPGLAARCRPVALDGPVVETERRRLDAVLAMRLAAACAWPDGGDLALAC